MDVSVEEEINQVFESRPHVVILGAGASYAALPRGDKYGKKLPLMNNLIDTLELNDLIDKTDLQFGSSNFEDIYSTIYACSNYELVLQEIETRVYRYFSEMKLPDSPTIYDHLVLSLRSKDIIATFNWDPFLVQAISRNGYRFKMPKVLFLHGNVAVSYCVDGHEMGNNGGKCNHCGSLLKPTKLLYPVGEKNYHLDNFISRQWATMQDALNHAFMVTIFGYGAPTSDASAIDLLRTAWGNVNERTLEELEIIDIRGENDLKRTWSAFIHSHHYQVRSDFYDSWIANHSRRTGEAYHNQFMQAKFIRDNPLPRDADFPELWDWYSRLCEVEDAGESLI
jgi:hypothetical protein